MAGSGAGSCPPQLPPLRRASAWWGRPPAAARIPGCSARSSSPAKRRSGAAARRRTHFRLWCGLRPHPLVLLLTPRGLYSVSASRTAHGVNSHCIRAGHWWDRMDRSNSRSGCTVLCHRRRPSSAARCCSTSSPAPPPPRPTPRSRRRSCTPRLARENPGSRVKIPGPAPESLPLRSLAQRPAG